MAIGYKDITVNENGGNQTYRLFVVAGRGGGYEQEWGLNMRVGASGDATGFQEARDGVLGFIMPYIQKHTNGVDNVKIWGSGYCRGGTAVNMALGWINKWIYERNPSNQPYKPYNDSYNEGHTVKGANYSPTEKRYTASVSFPTDYIDTNVHFSNDDVYCYAVNCPTATDAQDAAANEGLMVGFHNLINPDDWFPQIIMDWWGFGRYGYSHDHDITGTYNTADALHQRDQQIGLRAEAVNRMVANLREIDPGTAFTASLFRQRYFSKTSVATNGLKKLAHQLNKLLPKNKRFMKTENPPLFTISYDTEGEGNKYVSQGKELAYNQGRYYEEFFRFLLVSAGFDNADGTAAANRQKYAQEFEKPLENLMAWTMGPTVDRRAKLNTIMSAKAQEALTAMLADGIALAVDDNPVDELGASTSNTQLGRLLASLASTLVLDKQDIVADFTQRTLGPTLGDLGMTYDADALNEASNAVAKIFLGFYKGEQDMGLFNFYHALTMAKAGGAVAASHWPQQSLAWFSQFKVGEAIPGKTHLEGTEHNLTVRIDGGSIAMGTRRDGDILGTMALENKLINEGTVITGWTMLNGDGQTIRDNVTADHVVENTDPREIVLVANTTMLPVKHVHLWANVDESAPYVKDQKVLQLEIFEGGSQFLTDTTLPDGYDAKALGVIAYGDQLPQRPGFTFGGWATKADANGNSTAYPAEGDLSYEELPDGEVVDLYGLWYDEAVYGINYHANRNAGDTYVMAEQQVVDGDRLGVYGFDEDDGDAKLAGRSIVAWNTKPDGSGKNFATGAKVTPQELGLPSRDNYLTVLDHVDLNDEATAKAVEQDHTVDLYAQWNATVSYAAHVQGKGDLPAVSGGVTAGTTGQSRRLEAIAATVDTGSIEYRSHVQRAGWESSWARDGQLSGTTGQSRRIEAIQMRLSGTSGQSVWYRVHAQGYGWLGWACDGEPAGTAGLSKRLEAYEVVVLPEGQTPEGYDDQKPAYVGAATANVHVQGRGWTGNRSTLRIGTTGEGRRLEALRLSLPNQPYAGGIAYEVHVQGRGWMPAAADGARAGTVGQSRRIEAVRVRLTGELAEHFSVRYRAHSQRVGWGAWVSDGADAGTSGRSLRLEALDLQVVSK